MRTNGKLLIAVTAAIALAVGCQNESGDSPNAPGRSRATHAKSRASLRMMDDDGGVIDIVDDPPPAGDDGGAPPEDPDAGTPDGPDATVPDDTDADVPGSDAGPDAPDASYDECHPDVHPVRRNFFTGEITNEETGRSEVVPLNAMEQELVATPEIVAACDLTRNMLSEASPQHVFWYVDCAAEDPSIDQLLKSIAAKYEPDPILANYKCQRYLREDPIPCGVCDREE